MVEGQHYVGGEWRAARAGGTDEVVDPATGEVIATVPSGRRPTSTARWRARSARSAWGGPRPRARREKLYALAGAVEGDLELKRLEMRNVGKPASIVDFEFDLTVDNLQFFAGAARCLGQRGRGRVPRRPHLHAAATLGVVAGIAPWNHPLNMATWKLGPPRHPGSTFILKPSGSRRSPRCASPSWPPTSSPPGSSTWSAARARRRAIAWCATPTSP
ncbi:MAG: aldehyde dehydrogenase family protein [Acidimicrobiales bacterium]